MSGLLARAVLVSVFTLHLNIFSAQNGNASESRSLADAAQQKNWRLVEQLLPQVDKVGAQQNDGMTALHWAVHHGHLETVQALLKVIAKNPAEVKAEVNRPNNFGVIPLTLACINGHSDIVRALIAAGADVHVSGRGGESQLMIAARTGVPEVVQALIDAGARIEAIDAREQTALMWAAAEGNTAAIKVLIKAGAKIDHREEDNFSALLFAVRNGHQQAVAELVSAGADVNDMISGEIKKRHAAPRANTSAVMFALENGHYELALFLIDAGANVNEQRTGYTPLHAMSWVRRPKRGDDDGQPPPNDNGRMSSLQFVRELVKRGALVNAQVSKKISNRTVSHEGATPFFLAAQTADLELMKLLVELGADPLIQSADRTTSLMVAAGIGTDNPTEEPNSDEECLAAVEYILSFNPPLNVVNGRKDTVMHGAAYRMLPEVVRRLHKAGADISLQKQENNKGKTPIEIAEGFRPGAFKPSPETLAAFHEIIIASGLTPPPPTPRVEPGKDKEKKYE
jgi:uncharacterized protein